MAQMEKCKGVQVQWSHFIGENKSYYSSVQNNVVYLYMPKMLDIYRSTKLLNSALSSKRQKKDVHKKIVSSRMESLGYFL